MKTSIIFILIYLLLIGFIGIILLCVDKNKANNNKWRIPEKVLHIFEFLGGVFLMLPTMYVIRHKNRKASFYIITYIALVLWLVLGYFLFLG
ncbi:MAG: DUF1294 domain-containing protein [Bacteroidales bacterium]|nr:DUF1294 domain-containing protein [Bacteroidales bacterium]